jgi:DNA-binding NtrC family response regulator
MDIDELLQALSVGRNDQGAPLSPRAIVESFVRSRLSGASVTIAATEEASSTNGKPVGVPGLVSIPVPLRAGRNVPRLCVRPAPDRPLGPHELRFLERVAAVYALAAVADATPPGRGNADGLVRDGAAPLIGHSSAMLVLRERISRVAATDFTVLIEGESGSGKELVARQVHDLSRRRRGPFIAVNCAALVETLLEAELFGIEDRTATGVRGRRGKFEQATGGTLFLDEVADLSVTAQAKLLRAIQDFAVERVGGSQPRRVDIRLIVATNKRLRELSERGVFRKDLYYRLSGVELVVPPLRTRREDVAELARYFLARHRSVKPLELTLAAADALATYDWPGNVRELERLIESALTLAPGPRLDVADLPPEFGTRYADILQPSVQDRESLREWSRRYVNLVFQRCHENKREACRVLDISYHTLQAYLCRPVGNRRKNAPSLRSVGPAFLAAPGLVRERAEFGADDRATTPGHR